jgi:aspartyl-tRNA(Asn)/glutamyl-tRNA(Gln) amidotransferase subunit C
LILRETEFRCKPAESCRVGAFRASRIRANLLRSGRWLRSWLDSVFIDRSSRNDRPPWRHGQISLYQEFWIFMSIGRNEVDTVAHLARIAVEDQAAEALVKDLNGILGLVDQLNAAQTEGVEPLSHPLDMVQRLRVDEVRESNQRAAFQAIAPEVEAGLYLVPRVVE